MAESSEDIESGSYRLNFPVWRENEASIEKKLREFAFKLARRHSPWPSKKEASLDKKLREIAFITALIQKGSTTIGTMNFIWATAVLLGGFSTSLKSTDFWFVSALLVVEGLRILCQQGALAYQGSWPGESRLRFIIYIISSIIGECSRIVLCSLRIHKQQYGSEDYPNRNRALNLFYSMSLVESSLSLFGLLFRLAIIFPFSSKFRVDGLDNLQRRIGPRFFYDTYRRCMDGSVFDGLKMDFVSYSVELLQSIDHHEQLAGARFISMLLKSDLLPPEKLRVIGTTPRVLARLIELLNWEKPEEMEIRRMAGEMICKLVEIPRNLIRVMAIPESMESITSLLYDSNQIEIQSPDKYSYSAFSVLGKRILKILANDPDNSAKIGTNKGLLRKIIKLENLDPNASESEIIRHLESMPMETLADQQDVRENNNGTSGFEAEHSDHLN